MSPIEGPPSTRSGRPWAWDKPGSVMNFESISEEPGSSTTTRPPTGRTRGFTSSSGRQTVKWPFHSFSNSRSSISYVRRPSNSRSIPQSSGSLPRRAAGSISRSVSSILGSDIIPDYVVNFMRGETPESLAQRHRIPDSPEPGQFHRTPTGHLDISPDNSRPGTPRAEHEKMLVEERPLRTRSLMTGWRGGVGLNMFVAFLILAASVTCLALASAKGHMTTWESTLMQSNTTTVEGISRGIVAAVNIFAIALIAGANYVVQILNSPTRAEVDNAHQNFEWLDIGIPSLRNLSLISSTRATLSGIMMAFALVSQVIYNAVIISIEQSDKSNASLNVNGPLLAAITLVNLVLIFTYTIVIALALTRQSFNPLVTLGDALTSFLADPDYSTQDSCLMTKGEVKKGQWGEREGKYWYSQSSCWYNIPSPGRWTIWVLTWIMPVGLAAAALALGAMENPKQAFSTFGKAAVVYELPSGMSRSGLAIVAALPQLLLGLLYLSSNALLTLFFLSHEFSQFSSQLLPFRVSSGQPLGAQTTSLYLTLPRPVSWMLFFLITAMAYLLSQGILLVSVDSSQGSTTGIGFSPLPLLLLLVLLVVLASGVAVLSLRKVDPRGAVEGGAPAGNPLTLVGGTCSAVLSARCHRVPREGGVETLEVRWGVVREGVGMNAGHATFSGRPVGDIMVGRAYA
ncbi:uncharacterized protein B0J16DRAFT_69169 [Fusarium flagelliforme]|uniref:DUF6536 domain-containing protein n=1 Tax=Fusarium flagelliforme TaxID=2675880 RepID=A0A395MP04_9HYPO|nr:uncharacterized protein B0J16DRAFT_69169 [Fusarium flagelliforme]KAH7193009.1 hypothetical protein B0J16DRAFT_69169 [Fusarium flagelliforme]RFN49662.1 hypothetical protein FIE12Z_6109 [Fusarium flagelliforme]